MTIAGELVSAFLGAPGTEGRYEKRLEQIAASERESAGQPGAG